MAGPKEKLESNLRALERTLNVTGIEKQAKKLTDQIKASTTIKFKVSGDVSNGVKTLSQNVNDVVSQLEESVPSNISDTIAVAKIDKTASTSLSKPVADASKTDLESIVGKTLGTTTKQKNVTIVLPHPKSLANAFQKVTTETNDAIEGLVKDNINLKEIDFDENIINQVVGEVTKNKDNITNTLKEFDRVLANGTKNINNQINFGFGSLIENLSENIFAPARNKIFEVARKGDVLQDIPSKDLRDIISSVKVEENIPKALSILKRYSDLPEISLRAGLEFDNRAKAQLDKAAPVTLNVPVINTDTFLTVWREEKTDITAAEAFTDISDTKVFENEIANLQREVTEVIIFAYADGTDYGTTPVQLWHQGYVDNYNQAYPHHVYIPIMGPRASRGRPLELDLVAGIADIPESHNKRSIQIHIENVGYPNDGQLRILEDLLGVIYKVKPGIQVFGASDLGVGQEPYFNVDNFIKNKFNKSNIVDYDPKLNPPLTRKELVNYYKV